MSKRSSAAPRNRFALWFKTTREARGLIAAEASRELGVNTAAVTRWEQAKNLPMSSLLLRIAEWGEIDAKAFLTMLSEDNP